MKQEDIVGWLGYWERTKLVALDQITAIDQVREARKYCSCMRTGVFAPDLVTDLQIWRALLAKRERGSGKISVHWGDDGITIDATIP